MNERSPSTEKPPPEPAARRGETQPSPKKRRAPLSWPWASVILVVLLILPVWAAIELSQRFDWRFIVTYFVLISVINFAFYWSDKRKAQRDQWRVPEGSLHLLESLGGWPAALVAQRLLRHKTRKAAFQGLFWLIVLVHQLLAFEFVSQWHLSRLIWQSTQG